jgi:hypothetical protein
MAFFHLSPDWCTFWSQICTQCSPPPVSSRILNLPNGWWIIRPIIYFRVWDRCATGWTSSTTRVHPWSAGWLCVDLLRKTHWCARGMRTTLHCRLIPFGLRGECPISNLMLCFQEWSSCCMIILLSSCRVGLILTFWLRWLTSVFLCLTWLIKVFWIFWQQHWFRILCLWPAE